MISDQAIWQLNIKPGVGHHLEFTGWMASSRITKIRVWINKSSKGLEIVPIINRV